MNKQVDPDVDFPKEDPFDLGALPDDLKLNKIYNEDCLQIMAKALTHRNYEAARKLDEIEASMRWAKEQPSPIPEYKKCDIIKNNAGWINLLKTVIKEARL